MPTLYSSESSRKPKISMTDLVLYNMASMLACVATGYDVRMSNVSPVHPHLQPVLNDDFSVSSSAENELLAQERGFGHNTYHGPVKHTRYVAKSAHGIEIHVGTNKKTYFRATVASMSASDDRPIRFTDSPQHYLPSTMSTTSGLGSNYTTSSIGGQPPTPSPRRKTSASSFSEVPELHYDQNNRTPIYVPGNYVEYRPSHEDVVSNHGGYFGNVEDRFNDW